MLIYVYYSIYTAPTAEPGNVTAAALSSQSIHVSWDPPPFNNRNGQIRYYIIHVTEADTGNNFTQLVTGNEFTFLSLHPYYTYTFTVAAVTVELGPFSNIISVTTEEDGKKLLLRNLSCHLF